MFPMRRPAGPPPAERIVDGGRASLWPTICSPMGSGHRIHPQGLDPLMISEPSDTHDLTGSLVELIRTAEARITVIGLGYVGLPLALGFARAGFAVQGLDIDARKVASLLEGTSYIDDVGDSQIAEAVRSKQFAPTGDPSVLSEADAVILCVPTPYTKTKQPDLT